MRVERGYIVILAVCAFCLITAGCRPKGVLSSRRMREVIIDLHKTDALLLETGYRNNEREARSIYYAQVMEKHHITQAEFDSSLVWYTAHPALFDKIYPKVLKELKEEETTFLANHPEFGNSTGSDLVSRPDDTPPPFTHYDMDSVLWVIGNGYPNSWNEWRQPYRVILEE